MGKIKEYGNGEITIVWTPEKCIHSGICVKGLPDVFRPKEKPWIKMEAASTEALVKQVKACPSGALRFYMDHEKETATGTNGSTETKVEVKENGPLLVYGTVHLVHKDGTKETKHKTTAFCRCGMSGNKPFCDGAHVKESFKG